MQPVLEVRDLSIELPRDGDRRHAVEKVSFTVNPGEIVCLVGESGSGKSVIAQAVMGLLPRALRAVNGSIALEGENLLAASEERLRDLRCTRMSMIFQEPMTALNPVMTCGDQIDEVLRTHTKMDNAERRRRIVEMLAQVNMPDPERVYASYPHQLSGGQRQRIMIAMALVLEPTLLIADEPTTALDVTTQAQILELIKEIQRARGTGVLFITHDFGVVSEIADRVAVLRLGELVEFGETETLLRRPQHAYTRMLISSVPSMIPHSRPRDPDALVVLRTEGLSKVYGGGTFLRKGHAVRAAENVDIEIRRGEVLGIVGESGSGKSTVARCIARLIDPTGGRIYLGQDEFAGLSARQLRRHRHRIQIVFQDPYRSLNPRRTVGDSIVEGPMNFGIGRTEALQRARALMELVRLDPNSLDRYPHQFSGGQRQRICIARALAMEPELLIADEAVSALDVSVQAQVLRLLDDIREKLKLAMLFITHDLRVAAQVCDTVAVMERGRVVEYGGVQEIFSNPSHEYTRALLAAAPGKDWDFGAFEAA
ncbi:MAG: ABC transporter ATP-binding protein [Alphaproteobacteria bacterium]|nr:ABC transporter ATP-binding protein [Alphaproteobacteria bacterium]